jgi:uncharacterized membrane protein
MMKTIINTPNDIMSDTLTKGDTSLLKDALMESLIGSEMSFIVFALNVFLNEFAIVFAPFTTLFATVFAAFFILFTGAATNELILFIAALFDGFADNAFILLDDSIDC